MTSLISKLMGSKAGLKGVIGAAVLGLAPTAALANPHDDGRIDFRFGWHGPSIEIHRASELVYQDREVRVWIDPVYRTVCERVWVADRYEYRDVVHYWHGMRRIHTEQVLVESGHYQDVNHQEVVTPGHWETHIDRVRVR
ncbi:MAG TPA: hypothetical protein VIM11_02350 [Tepidisphaeraceae bacterium]|jgi:hypothetical protein